MEFKQTKVKKIARFRPERSVPYPESLKSASDYCGSKVIVGKYNGSNVIIDDPELTLAIYNLGCFGKGSLSRGEPNYYLRAQAHEQKSSPVQHNEVKKNEQSLSDTGKNISDDHVSPSKLVSKENDCTESDYNPKCQEELNPQDENEMGLPQAKEEFTFQETLHLNLEEAYFLCYGIGCLEVVDLFDKKLSLQEAWELFCESQDDFVQKYVVYHYFRSKGWVVKPGLKFGGDFVLYKWGANITHASYIVVIEVIQPNGNMSEDQLQGITWTKFISLNRMAETAGKEVILCRVVWPQDVLFNDIHSPEEIKKFGVEEILTRRWVSSQERELLDKDEIQ